MILIIYNRENSRPQEVTYKGKQTINLDGEEPSTCPRQCPPSWGLSAVEG